LGGKGGIDCLWVHFSRFSERPAETSANPMNLSARIRRLLCTKLGWTFLARDKLLTNRQWCIVLSSWIHYSGILSHGDKPVFQIFQRQVAWQPFLTTASRSSFCPFLSNLECVSRQQISCGDLVSSLHYLACYCEIRIIFHICFFIVYLILRHFKAYSLCNNESTNFHSFINVKWSCIYIY